MKRFRISIITISVVIFMLSCQKQNDLSFDPMTNFPDNDTVVIDMDLHDVVNQGIVIPSERQATDGAFVFNFKGEKGQYYKIYYQNESYKFQNDNKLSNENFYGSWEDVSVGFKKIEETGVITDSFRIVGNPRDERKFYGADVTENTFNEESVRKIIDAIKNTPAWYASIVQKAENNGYSIEKQLHLDAMWMVKHRRNEGDFNNRWKRNPRVGCYSFMLVVCEENALNSIPEYVKNIGATDENGAFVNPYSYFENHKSNDIQVVVSNRVLKTRAVITPEEGVFINEMDAKSDDYTVTESEKCGTSDELYQNALYEQFMSQVSQQYTLRNIPVIQDVVSGENPYTRADYEANKTRFDSTELLYDYPVPASALGTTVKVNDDNSISLINPKSTPGDLQKESTGIRTRLGFTYGKYRGKIKFPVMLNDDNVWNGLTYAFWLIYQDNHEWNNRRSSEAGYVEKGDESLEPKRLKDYFYSEIDIEIVKASRFWPAGCYKNLGREPKVEDATSNSDVMYCCTNWDLASPEPKRFKAGINDIPYQGVTREGIRWSNLYKALTTKTPISNDVFKEDYYYYEIEWRPTEIIWRIGPSPDKMEVVGYMNDEYTLIPNNQMLCIITQEYHYSEWWPPVVFYQGLIPYNKTDIEGRVYEIVVE